jgi:transposase InsO family protein
MVTKMRSIASTGLSTAEMCSALGVSRSGFYAHAQKPDRDRRRKDELIAEKISLIFIESRRTYGCRRIQAMLGREGMHCGKARICRLMRERRLQPVHKRRLRPKTTQSRHGEPIAANRLKELPEPPKQPNEVWCADITYIPSQQEGWLYLAAEFDLCSRRLVGWKLGDSLAAPLVIDAFQRAVRNWSIAPALHHCDRGVQYASSHFRHLLDSHGVLPSVSRKACCFDNAAIESFWATLKTECFHNQIPLNQTHAQALLFDYIETFYNPKRLHSSLGYLSPLEFEISLLNQQKYQI